MKARKLSHADLSSLLNSTATARDNNAIVLRAIFNGEGIDASECCKIDGARYILNLYSATRANGGIVAVLFDSPHNRAISVDCIRLDDLSYPNVPEYLPLRIAIERLRVARNQLLAVAA